MKRIDIDKLEELPKRMSRYQYLDSKGLNMYDLDKFDHPWYRDLKYWEIRKRILENNIGKSFDLAFSYYCKLVPKRLQHEFLEEFELNSIYKVVDGIIQKAPQKVYKHIYQLPSKEVLDKYAKKHITFTIVDKNFSQFLSLFNSYRKDKICKDSDIVHFNYKNREYYKLLNYAKVVHRNKVKEYNEYQDEYTRSLFSVYNVMKKHGLYRKFK